MRYLPRPLVGRLPNDGITEAILKDSLATKRFRIYGNYRHNGSSDYFTVAYTNFLFERAVRYLNNFNKPTTLWEMFKFLRTFRGKNEQVLRLTLPKVKAEWRETAETAMNSVYDTLMANLPPWANAFLLVRRYNAKQLCLRHFTNRLIELSALHSLSDYGVKTAYFPYFRDDLPFNGAVFWLGYGISGSSNYH